MNISSIRISRMSCEANKMKMSPKQSEQQTEIEIRLKWKKIDSSRCRRREMSSSNSPKAHNLTFSKRQSQFIDDMNDIVNVACAYANI